MMETPPWDPPSPEFSRQEQSMCDYRGWFVSPSTPAWGQLFMNSVTLYAHDAADVMDNDNYATMLESFVSTLSLWATQVNTKKVLVLDHLFLAKKWIISPKKALIMIHHTTQHGIHIVLHLPLSRQFRANDCQLWYKRSPHEMYSDTLFATTLYRRGSGVHRFLPPTLVCNTHSPWSWKVKPMKHCPFSFSGMGATCDNIWQCQRNGPWWVFFRKLKKALFHLRQIEPFISWSNETEREIKEPNKGSVKKLIKSGAPKRLCEDCPEFEPYLRSNMAQGIYKLDGEVPDSIMLG